MKQALKDELVQRLSDTLASARVAHASASEGATHGEAKAENDKDTRGLEQSYLARGQALRVEELAAELAAVEKMSLAASTVIAAGSLVIADEDGESRSFFVAPGGAGEVLTGGVQVVTPRSPLGRALCGRRVDDTVELKVPGRTRELEITRIA